MVKRVVINEYGTRKFLEKEACMGNVATAIKNRYSKADRKLAYQARKLQRNYQSSPGFKTGSYLGKVYGSGKRTSVAVDRKGSDATGTSRTKVYSVKRRSNKKILTPKKRWDVRKNVYKKKSYKKKPYKKKSYRRPKSKYMKKYARYRSGRGRIQR
jgi:hypothetical protein